MSEREVLLTCPCCNGPAAVNEDRFVFDSGDGYRVECQQRCMMTCWWHTTEQAKSAWNTRYIPATPATAPANQPDELRKPSDEVISRAVAEAYRRCAALASNNPGGHHIAVACAGGLEAAFNYWAETELSKVAATANPELRAPSSELVGEQFQRALFLIANSHQPSDYNGGDYDWSCECGAVGHYEGSPDEPNEDTWERHILSLGDATAKSAARCPNCESGQSHIDSQTHS